uniref:NADH dehydrogenase subunit 4L n=1 Tax=Rotundella rotunda TaxID=1357779 RepID=A0A076YK10_9CHLO|nr:NADH dehydrogenase subunit 4L [Rotundella rotunda]
MSLSSFFLTYVVLFSMGAIGTFLNRRNFIIMIVCIEIMLLSTNLIFLTASVSLDDLNGQLLALWVLTAAAAETALGLALCVLHFRLRATLDVELINLMKG